MLTNFLIKKFIMDSNNVQNREVRKKYGYLGGFVGFISNILLFLIKMIMGLMVNSISLIADGVNNLSDVGTSAITILGFKLSSKPADKEHPFGHGRTEYIAALIISLIIMLVGFELVQSSIKRIIHPVSVSLRGYTVVILLLTIGIKIWLCLFYRRLGKSINSKPLIAASIDSLSDVFATSCVIISIILSPYLSFPIDAYIGLIVAGVIMYSGFSMARDTLNPLLGQAPDPELVKNIKDSVLHFDGIEGIHDLIVHDYGPNRTMATLHAEVSQQLTPVVAHEIVDAAERKVAEEFNVLLVIHTDPLNFDCHITDEAYQKIKSTLSQFNHVKSFHDFRIIKEGGKKFMIFDVVVEEQLKELEIEDLKNEIKDKLKTIFTEVQFIITMKRKHTFLH